MWGWERAAGWMRRRLGTVVTRPAVNPGELWEDRNLGGTGRPGSLLCCSHGRDKGISGLQQPRRYIRLRLATVVTRPSLNPCNICADRNPCGTGMPGSLLH